MDLGLVSKICLVTGASTGIGRATAIALAHEGARVVVSARTEGSLHDLAAVILEADGIEVVGITVDLATSDGPALLGKKVLAAVGRVDVLINNAGGSRPMTHADDEQVWEKSFLLNFGAARQLTNVLAPLMLERGWGQVVNVSGTLVVKRTPLRRPRRRSKAGRKLRPPPTRRTASR